MRLSGCSRYVKRKIGIGIVYSIHTERTTLSARTSFGSHKPDNRDDFRQLQAIATTEIQRNHQQQAFRANKTESKNSWPSHHKIEKQ
jgi:hypothetical protein